MFERFGGPKRALELRSELEKARADVLSGRSSWEREKAKEAKLGRQVESCRIVAPADGEIVYANQEGWAVPAGQAWPPIEEGAMIREGQPIFSIPDLSGPMRVNVKMPEWAVDWIKPGLPARIQVEESDGEELPGLVESIAPLPEAASFVNGQIRSYTTFVAIQKMPAGLAPGMPALVKIPTTELDDVLVVPASTPVYYDHKDHVAVRRPDGGYDWRQVTLGLSDGAMVEVKEGLKGGEVVAFEPDPLLSGGQKLRISRSKPRPPPSPARLANPAR